MSDRPSPQLLAAQDAYRLWAPEYDSSPNPLLSLQRRLLAPLLSLAAGCDVVDLGCGTGQSIVELARLGARSIVGVDFSQEMLERASNRLPRCARLVEADCRDTKLDAQCCDWVLASLMLSYLDNLAAFAREAARISRPQAFVLIADVHPATRSYGWKRTIRLSENGIEIQTHPYEISDLYRVMQAAGFDPVYLKETSFGPEELSIFSQAGRPDLYWSVESLPVFFAAGYRRERE
jgi:ubiquinone/menaquinone biosynthesis C-methylase UbiE